MNKQQGIGILLLMCAGVWWYIRRTANSISVSFNNLQYISISSEGIILRATVLIHNPLLADVTINEIVGDIYVMDKFCATVDYPVRQRLKAGKSSKLYVNFTVKASELNEALWESIQTGDADTLTVRFDGYVGVGSLHIPIDREFIIKNLL